MNNDPLYKPTPKKSALMETLLHSYREERGRIRVALIGATKKFYSTFPRRIDRFSPVIRWRPTWEDPWETGPSDAREGFIFDLKPIQTVEWRLTGIIKSKKCTGRAYTWIWTDVWHGALPPSAHFLRRSDLEGDEVITEYKKQFLYINRLTNLHFLLRERFQVAYRALQAIGHDHHEVTVSGANLETFFSNEIPISATVARKKAPRHLPTTHIDDDSDTGIF